jgi:hypothetical protein
MGFCTGDSSLRSLLNQIRKSIEEQDGAATLPIVQQNLAIALLQLSQVAQSQTSKPPWRDRKERYIQQMRQASADVHLVPR